MSAERFNWLFFQLGRDQWADGRCFCKPIRWAQREHIWAAPEQWPTMRPRASALLRPEYTKQDRKECINCARLKRGEAENPHRRKCAVGKILTGLKSLENLRREKKAAALQAAAQVHNTEGQIKQALISKNCYSSRINRPFLPFPPWRLAPFSDFSSPRKNATD